MIKGLKICGISDPVTLNYILNHNYKPIMIGFITNYEKSKRFVEFEKLKDLINVKKKEVSFISVLVNPNDENLVSSTDNIDPVEEFVLEVINKEKRIIQAFQKSLLLISTSSFSVFMVADILSSTIGLGY